MEQAGSLFYDLFYKSHHVICSAQCAYLMVGCPCTTLLSNLTAAVRRQEALCVSLLHNKADKTIALQGWWCLLGQNKKALLSWTRHSSDAAQVWNLLILYRG